MKRTRLNPISKRRKSRVGKTGTIRLRGKDVKPLRDAVWERCGGLCELRHYLLEELAMRYLADEFTDSHYHKLHDAVRLSCERQIRHRSFEMAHLKSRGSGGSDELGNVVAACGTCHRLQHSGIAPCAPKPKVREA